MRGPGVPVGGGCLHVVSWASGGVLWSLTVTVLAVIGSHACFATVVAVSFRTVPLTAIDVV